MKKIYILITIFLLSLFIVDSKKASAKQITDYTNFETITMSKGKLLKEYSNSDLEKELKNLDKRKWIGWRTKILNKDVYATFVSETVFSYYNTSTTSIEYEYTSSYIETTKVSISCTGTISYKMNGNSKTFKNGLDGQTKFEYSKNNTIELKETEKIKMSIEPNTICNMYLVGNATVTNGVGINYVWWIKTQRGGFEYFVITSLYPRLEKMRI